MAIDFPDFHAPRISWPRRDWATKLGEHKTWFVYSISSVSPGATDAANIYTVPSGKIIYYSEGHGNVTCRGIILLEVPNVVQLYYAILDWHQSTSQVLSTPLPILAGQTIYFETENMDRVWGHYRFYFVIWESAASEPENPKNQTPQELYRTGEFNSCNVFLLKDKEQIFLFSKSGERKRNYLRVKDYATKKEKILASFKIKERDLSKLHKAIIEKPKELPAFLKKIEKKYLKT